MGSMMLDAALRYANLGLAVIPLHPRDKRPMFENWPEIATTDQELIGRWWQHNPAANVGIATGQKSRVFVLDVDTAKGGTESYESLVTKYGQFPNTWQQITGSGGYHLFFRYPNFRVGNCAGLFPGIDIRGDGGQVVAPPSIHPSGNQYTWDGLAEIEQTPIAEAPQWLIELLAGRSNPTGKQSVSVPIKIPHGIQHHTLVSVAGHLRRMGLDADDIYPSLKAINDRHCEQPGPAEHIRQIAHSMMRYRPDDRDLFSTAYRVWRMEKAKQHEAEREQEENGVEMIDGLSVYRSPVRSSKCVVDKLVYHGLTVFAGRPKQGKSWCTLQTALSIARGLPVLGKVDVLRPGAVLYLALEESQDRTSTRMHNLMDQEEVHLQNLVMVYKVKPMLSGGLSQLDDMLARVRPNVVIIDTFLGFLRGGGGDGRGNVMREEYSQVDALKKLSERHDTAIVLVHHLKKTNGVDLGIDGVAGSTGITAAADCIWTLKRQPENMAVLDIVGRDTEEQSIALQWSSNATDFGWRIIGDGQSVKTSQDEREIIKLLQAEGSMTSMRIGTALKLHANRSRELLYDMYQRGVIGKTSKGDFYAA